MFISSDNADRFLKLASTRGCSVSTMVLSATRGLVLFRVIREAVTWKSVEVTVRRRRSRPDLISHDEYPRSYSGKATTCRKRSDNVPGRSKDRHRNREVTMHLPASRR